MNNQDVAPIEDTVTFELSDIFIFLWQKKIRIVLTTMILAALAGQHILKLPKYYTAYSTLMLGGENDGLGLPSSLASFDYRDDSMMDTYIEFMRSRQYAKRVVESERLFLLSEFQSPADETQQDKIDTAIAVLQSSVSFSQVGETDLLRVSYTSLTPDIAARVANVIGPEFFLFYENMNKERANDASSFLSSQLTQLQEKLTSAEAELQGFINEKDILDLESQSDITLTEITTLLSEKLFNDKTLASLSQTNASVKLAGDSIASLMAIQWFQQNPLVVDLRNKILLQEQQLQQISKRYKYKHPKHIAVMGQLNALKAEQKSLFEQLKVNLQQQYDNLKTRQNGLQSKINELKKDHSQMGKYQIQLSKLRREVEMTQTMYESFLARLQETEIVKDLGNKEEFAVVDYANAPSFPSKPKVSLLIIMAGVFSFIISAVFWFILHLVSDRATRIRQLMKSMDIPILTEIPKLSSSRATKAIAAAVKGEIGDYLFSESIRSLRTSTLVSMDETEKRIILVTGVGKEPGKSMVALNLAASFGKLEKTLLVDVDLRSPSIGKTFKLDKEHPGIMDFVARKVKFSDCIHRQLDSQLFVVPGRETHSDPMIYLSRSRFSSLLKKLGVLYERVIIDTPSLSSYSDALVVSRFVDGVIIVCDPDSTKKDDLLQTIQKLQETGAPLMGVVLNKVKDMRKNFERDSRLRRVMNKVTGN
ncbi:polysaccharide biosynthesis tyrosine autokinase [Aliiglaciecola sp.]|nr:polysaccharide biosynthesis tyrosine autokinase [Aliiglaciecola sp.]